MIDFYYRKLDAYNLAKELVVYVYQLLHKFPAYENNALCSQLRRAAVSIPSNIAEGMGRFAVKERIHFLEIAYGSLMEVMCLLEISQTLGYISEEELSNSEKIAEKVSRVMSGLRKSLQERTSK